MAWFKMTLACVYLFVFPSVCLWLVEKEIGKVHARRLFSRSLVFVYIRGLH